MTKDDIKVVIDKHLGEVITQDSDVFILRDLLAEVLYSVYLNILNFPQLKDPDRTITEFLQYFLREVGVLLPQVEGFDSRTFIKESKAWYSARSTKPSFKFIDNVFNIKTEIFEPARQLLICSEFPEVMVNEYVTTKGDDLLGHSNIKTVFKVYKDGVIYDSGVDFDYDSLTNKIVWLNGGRSPVANETYYINYSYNGQAISGHAKLRNGLYWTIYTYLVKVYGAQIITDYSVLIKILDLIHLAGAQRFVQFFRQYEVIDEPPTFYTMWLKIIYFIFYRVLCALDIDLIISGTCKLSGYCQFRVERTYFTQNRIVGFRNVLNTDLLISPNKQSLTIADHGTQPIILSQAASKIDQYDYIIRPIPTYRTFPYTCAAVGDRYSFHNRVLDNDPIYNLADTIPEYTDPTWAFMLGSSYEFENTLTRGISLDTVAEALKRQGTLHTYSYGTLYNFSYDKIADLMWDATTESTEPAFTTPMRNNFYLKIYKNKIFPTYVSSGLGILSCKDTFLADGESVTRSGLSDSLQHGKIYDIEDIWFESIHYAEEVDFTVDVYNGAINWISGHGPNEGSSYNVKYHFWV